MVAGGMDAPTADATAAVYNTMKITAKVTILPACAAPVSPPAASNAAHAAPLLVLLVGYFAWCAPPSLAVASPFLFVGEHLGSIAASAFLLFVHASAICERHHTTDNLRCPCVPPTADRQWKYTCSKHVHIAKPAAMAPYSGGLWRWRHGCLRHRGRPRRAPGVRMGNEREAPNLQ
jgi:hypothetical protein